MFAYLICKKRIARIIKPVDNLSHGRMSQSIWWGVVDKRERGEAKIYAHTHTHIHLKKFFQILTFFLVRGEERLLCEVCV